jgi:malate dehydrogenase (oxaloacetate-decarboxylating)(NADP+)
MDHDPQNRFLAKEHLMPATNVPLDSETMPKGMDLLHNPHLNKGTAFTLKERDYFHLHGLLPCKVLSQQQQADRVYANFRLKPTDMEKYIFLKSLQSRNETLFYYVISQHIEEMMPIIYTPTVGQACQKYSTIFRRPQGIYVSDKNKGRYKDLLKNWDQQDVRVIVITDGERILGLGDLGANGMGIPEGKLSLYTACAGVHPSQCLPATLDIGTNNQRLLDDPGYIGRPQNRIRGEAYDALIEEFFQAANEVFPNVLIQFEDFANANAFRLLQNYRDRYCTFNDDIQGTAAVTLAGIYSALRITKNSLADQKFLFLGAGEAGIGIGHLIVSALKATGMNESDAREKCWFVDSRGLVVSSREDLTAHKLDFAHDAPFVATLEEAIEQLHPTALIGVSGIPGSFSRKAVEMMTRYNSRPIVFALSNPTSKAECTAEQAYNWSGGRAIFASGSPFDPVEYQGQTFVPGQGNNAYIFPGVGLGIVATKSQRVPDAMFFKAAQVLASLVQEDDLQQGRIYPPLSNIRKVSFEIAKAVAQIAFDEGLAQVDRPEHVDSLIRPSVYEPVYPVYVN